MKCPECGGAKNFISLANTPWEVIRPCKRCNGTGEIFVDNESWFNRLSTEEKAQALNDLYWDTVWEFQHSEVEVTSKWFKKWLKSEHEYE